MPLSNLSQPVALRRLMEQLEHVPTDDLIHWVGLNCHSEADQTEIRKRQRQAQASAFAFAKVTHYLQAMRTLNRRRESLNEVIAYLLSVRPALSPSTVDRIACIDATTAHLAGDLEVILHLLAVSVAQIARLLPEAAKGAGIKLLAKERDYLSSFDALRDHFEHLNERLPGRQRADSIVTETEGENGPQVDIGFNTDDEGRILLHDKKIDLTSRGLQRVDAICTDIYARMRATLLDDARKFFENHPDKIPEKVEIQWHTYVRKGGEAS